MVRVPSRLAAAIGCVSLLGVAASARAQTPVSAAASEAFGISASFTSQGMSTSLGPVAEVAGSAPPAYSKTKTIASYDQSIAVPPLVPGGIVHPIVAQFTADAQGITSHVASGGIQIDFVTAVGTSNVASANLLITQVGPAATGTAVPKLVFDYLDVTASGVSTSATYSKVFPRTTTAAGAVSFKSLTITGSLLDGKTVTLPSGPVAPNTELFHSNTVTITAHQQIVAGLISCSPNCSFTPYAVTVHALDINLDNAVIDGHKVSGDIILGSAWAQ